MTSDAGSKRSADLTRTDLNQTQVSTLQSLGVLGPHRPIDDLIERVRRRDAAAWLSRALARGPLAGAGTAEAMLLRGEATLAQLREIKSRSKKLLRSAGDDDERLSGMAGYFLSIAAALQHHRELIGGRDRNAVNAILRELAEFTPEPWQGLLCRATLVKA